MEMTSMPSEFVELDLGESETQPLVVELPQGARIKIADSSQVQLAVVLLKTLAQ